jgi:transposase-like protein
MSRDCPNCKKTLTRIRRKPWMRRLPGSKHYKCRECGYAYLLIFNRWLLRRKQTDQTTASHRRS